MNILIDQLPTAVEVGGKEYAINTDFRACILTILAYKDPELTGFEKQSIMLQNLYPVMPDDPGAAINQAQKFLNGGKLDEAPDESPMRLYSFAKDAGLIFAAFKQTFDIDMETVEMHWWKFLALFADLGAETRFCGEIIPTRYGIKTGTATKEQKQRYRDHPEIYDLPEPDTLTAEERAQEEEFMKLVQRKAE